MAAAAAALAARDAVQGDWEGEGGSAPWGRREPGFVPEPRAARHLCSSGRAWPCALGTLAAWPEVTGDPGPAGLRRGQHGRPQPLRSRARPLARSEGRGGRGGAGSAAARGGPRLKPGRPREGSL